jgi:type III secretion protein L
MVAEGPIIRAEEYAGRRTGADLIEEAKTKAKTILERARQQTDQMAEETKKVYEQEKQRGYVEGKLVGHQKTIDLMFEMMDKGIDYITNLEATVVHVIRQSLNRILGDMGEEERITKVVRQALKTIRDSKSVRVRLHPEQVGFFRAPIDERTKSAPDKLSIEYVPDNQLQKDQCVLETEFGIIDAGLELQQKSILDALEKAVH